MWPFKKSNKQLNNDPKETKPNVQSYTILIAEDEVDLREVLTDKLEEEGFKVIATANGEECINEALANHPDLILLDLYMPKVSGFEVLDKMIGDPWGRNAKIIVLTNRGDLTTKRNVYNLKQVSYLIKAETGLNEVVKAIKEKLTEVKDESLPI